MGAESIEINEGKNPHSAKICSQKIVFNIYLMLFIFALSTHDCKVYYLRNLMMMMMTKIQIVSLRYQLEKNLQFFLQSAIHLKLRKKEKFSPYMRLRV